MTDKQALRMRNYLNTAVISGVKLLHLTTDELSGLLDELEAAQQERKNWRTSFDNERFRADKLAAAFNAEYEQLVMANRALITQHTRANEAEAQIAELERELDAMEAAALAMRDDMRQVREQLEAAEKRITELQSEAERASADICKGE